MADHQQHALDEFLSGPSQVLQDHSHDDENPATLAELASTDNGAVHDVDPVLDDAFFKTLIRGSQEPQQDDDDLTGKDNSLDGTHLAIDPSLGGQGQVQQQQPVSHSHLDSLASYHQAVAGPSSPSPLPLVKRLKANDMFPWPLAKFFIPDYHTEALRAHLEKRITKAGGHLSGSIDDADFALINPHDKFEHENQLMREHPKVLAGDAQVQPYHWFARCYFSRHVVKKIETPPIFVDHNEQTPMLVAVGSLPPPLDRTKLMTTLEQHGAIIVPENQCAICIVHDKHNFLVDKPKEPRYAEIEWKAPGWVNDSIKAGHARWWEFGDKKKTAKVTRRSNGRTEFTAGDRDMLARWLATRKPTETGRTSRSLYRQLDAMDQSIGSLYEWVSRHTGSAWHEHYRKTKNKEWKDGRVLSREVNRYVALGVDGSLKTAGERANNLKIGEGDNDERVYDPDGTLAMDEGTEMEQSNDGDGGDYEPQMAEGSDGPGTRTQAEAEAEAAAAIRRINGEYGNDFSSVRHDLQDHDYDEPSTSTSNKRPFSDSYPGSPNSNKRQRLDEHPHSAHHEIPISLGIPDVLTQPSFAGIGKGIGVGKG